MIAWGGALLGSMRGSSTCIDTMVDLSMGLGSDFVLSFFFFFLDISISVSYFGQLLLPAERADHSPEVSSAGGAAISSVSFFFFFFLFLSLTPMLWPSSCVVTSSISAPFVP